MSSINCWDLFDLVPNDLEIQRKVNDDSHKQAARIKEALSDTVFMTRLRQSTWEAISVKCHSSSDELMEETISKALFEVGMRNVISAVAVNLHEHSQVLDIDVEMKPPSRAQNRKYFSRTSDDEKKLYVKSARIAWENGINEELAAIATEKRRPFIALMPEGTEEHPLLCRHMSAAARQDVRFLFDSAFSDDLLDTITRITPPHDPSLERHLGVVKIPFNLPTIRQISARYRELGRGEMHMGLDDEGGQYGVKFYQSRHNEAARLIGGYGSVLDARAYLRKGCPPSLRGCMWRLALCLPPNVSRKEKIHFERLQRLCRELDIITDDLYVMDVNSFCDDTSFFVFEEHLREIALCFSRDEAVSKDCQYVMHKPLLGSLHVKHPDVSPLTPCPPCGMQPFLGFSAYLSPFTYVFKDLPAYYSTAKAMFCRLWCRVNTISGDQGCLPYLCASFENFLLQSDMRLYLHIIKLGMQPLQIAFPWIQQGFVGFLDVEQILILWDRLLGFMDITILACLAAAVFIYRSQSILECEDAAGVTDVMSIGSGLKVIPLLQFFLFSEK